MPSFISSPFKLLLGYWILSNFDDNYSCPPKKNLDTTTLAHICMANWRPTRGLSWLFFPPLITWLIMDIIKLIVVPLPPPIFYSYLIFGDGFVVYIHIDFP